MTALPSILSRLLVVGGNHRSASLGLRDQLFVEDAGVPHFLDELRLRGLHEAMILSTCDRVEVAAVHDDPDFALSAVTAALLERVQATSAHPEGNAAHLAPSAVASQLYFLRGREAVRHCFAVTASLDSQVIGEPQVLGQVKAAHKLARDGAMMGGDLDSLWQAAFSVAKKVRSDTHIAERPVSIASSAVQIARDLHGDLSRCSGLLLGAGDMGEVMAEGFLAAGLGRLTVTAARASRADALAKQLDCHVVAYEQRLEALNGADIVIAAVGTRAVLLGSGEILAALKKRRRKPMFLVDAAIPGDLDPAINRIDGAFLYDLHDLEKIALEGRASREAASTEAWAIVEAEVETFLRTRAARAAIPAIVALRDRAETLRAQVLIEAGQDAEKATRLLLHRLLHDPQEVMKDMAAAGEEWQAAEGLLRHLFRLEDGR